MNNVDFSIFKNVAMTIFVTFCVQPAKAETRPVPQACLQHVMNQVAAKHLLVSNAKPLPNQLAASVKGCGVDAGSVGLPGGANIVGVIINSDHDESFSCAFAGRTLSDGSQETVQRFYVRLFSDKEAKALNANRNASLRVQSINSPACSFQISHGDTLGDFDEIE